MLQPSSDDGQSDVPLSPVTDSTESSMWCSNLDKFSNILRSSMTNLNTASDNHRTNRTQSSLNKSVDSIAVSPTALDDLEEREESSETESQQTEERVIDESECSEEEHCYSKPLSSGIMKHYYLSTNNLLNTTE